MNLLPSLQLALDPTSASLLLVAAPGTHFADEAPASLAAHWDDGDALALEGLGRILAKPTVVPARPGHLDVEVEVSVCTDDGATCNPLTVAFSADLPAKSRAKLTLPGTGVAPGAHEVPVPVGVDVAAAYAAAVQRASVEGKPLLLDFGAVWCPPCNQLAAELLHANHPILSGFEVLAIDADDPTSWSVKSRYAVTGYPTVVIAKADGSEIDRLIGYPGLSATVDFLGRAAEGRLPPADPDATTPAMAAREALRRARNDLGGIDPWLLRASTEPENADYRLARFLLVPTAADLSWLVAHGVSIADWGFAALESEDAALRAATRAAAIHKLPTLTGSAAVDAAWIIAETSPEAERAHWFAVAASIARTHMDHVGLRGMGPVLADLLAELGDEAGAADLYRQLAGAFPTDPSWPLALSRLSLHGGDAKLALSYAETASALAWGDLRLRGALAQAEAYKALGRPDDARRVAQEALAGQPAPDPALQVRTHKYRKQLEAVGQP